MEGKRTILLKEQNATIDGIVSGYLLEKGMRVREMERRFVIEPMLLDANMVATCLKYGLDPYYYQDSYAKENVDFILNVPKDKSLAIAIYKENEAIYDRQDLTLTILAGCASLSSQKNPNVEDLYWIKQMCQKQKLSERQIREDALLKTSLSHLSKAGMTDFVRYNNQTVSSHIRISKEEMYKYEIEEILEILSVYRESEKLTTFILFIDEIESLRTISYKITQEKIEKREYEGILNSVERKRIMQEPQMKTYQLKIESVL